LKETAGFLARKPNNGELLNALDPNILAFTELTEPLPPPSNAAWHVKDDYKEDKKIYKKEIKEREEWQKYAYSEIIGQVGPSLLDIIESEEHYTDIKMQQDSIDLLKLIRQGMFTGATSAKKMKYLSRKRWSQ
jgi:hypothetical protein